MLRPQQRHAQRRMGYLYLRRPLHLNQDEEEVLHELNTRAPVEIEVEPPRRSDVTTESVYLSSGNTPPLRPKTAARPDWRLLRPLETAILPPKSLYQWPTSTPSPPTPTPTYSRRDLQRQ